MDYFHWEKEDEPFIDVAVVGAGPSGIGIATILKDLGCRRLAILERREPGASFRMWPEETRLLTPSFTTNFYGPMDMNSVVAGTSVAYTLGQEHPDGHAYADYLQLAVDHFELPVCAPFDVVHVLPGPDYFTLTDNTGTSLRARYVVWAAGEYQYPKQDGFPGAEVCRHYATIQCFADLSGDEFVVIGGYESGIDAAIHLSRNGKRVSLIAKEDFRDIHTTDPSLSLSPFTRGRLNDELTRGFIKLVGDTEVTEVVLQEGVYRIYTDSQEEALQCKQAPILATGFRSSLVLIQDLFENREGSTIPHLTDDDESTITPGLFLAGPQVRHNSIIFCFIYKFRQRFGVVARALGERLGLNTSGIEQYRREGLLLDDLSCCSQECSC